MKISKRLETICSLVAPGSFVADVGADHGLVEKYLLDHELCSYVLAIENKKGPFSNLKRALSSYSKAEAILSDGIESITDKIDTVILAGMGGINIIDILNKNKDKLQSVKNIIIDPHRDIALTRSEITKLGFAIKEEKIVFEDKKFYNIISFTKGAKKLSFEEIEWGYNVTKLENFNSYKEFKLGELKIKLNALEKSKNSSVDEINEIKNKIERLEKYGN